MELNIDTKDLLASIGEKQVKLELAANYAASLERQLAEAKQTMEKLSGEITTLHEDKSILLDRCEELEAELAEAQGIKVLKSKKGQQ